MPKRFDKVSKRRPRKPAGRNASEPRCSFVKTKLRRATLYLRGEASITGCRTSVHRPWLLRSVRDGMSGKATRQLGRPLRPLVPRNEEETFGIRLSRNPGEVVRESDGVIVPMNSETT